MDISYISLRRYVNIRKLNVNFSRIKIFMTIRVLFTGIRVAPQAKEKSKGFNRISVNNVD